MRCRYAVGEEAALVKEVLTLDGHIVLIAGEHHAAPGLAARLADPISTPPSWPDDRFDVTWIVDWRNGPASFRQQPQCLLGGDRTETIAA